MEVCCNLMEKINYSYSTILWSFGYTHLWVGVICALRRNKSNVAGFDQVCNEIANLNYQFNLRFFGISPPPQTFVHFNIRINEFSYTTSHMCPPDFSHENWNISLQINNFCKLFNPLLVEKTSFPYSLTQNNNFDHVLIIRIKITTSRAWKIFKKFSLSCRDCLLLFLWYLFLPSQPQLC